MSRERSHADIGSAVLDASFPDVDMALRRGRHIDRDDTQWYAFLLDAQHVLEEFYRRFGCELVHQTEGYFYLLPTGDRLGKRQLSAAEMLVGQALALLYLDPKTVQSGGVVTRDDVLGHMASVMTTDGLVQAFHPTKRRVDERVAQATVRAKVSDGLRKLAAGGFIEQLAGENIRLRAAVMRFAEPVRTAESPREALTKLVARGEVMLQEPQATPVPPGASDAGEANAEDDAGNADFDVGADTQVASATSTPVLDDFPEFDAFDAADPDGQHGAAALNTDAEPYPPGPGDTHE